MGTQKSINKSIWKNVALGERTYYIAREMTVLYPDFLKIVKAIKRRRNRCQNEKKGAAIMCYIPSGAGKSFLCRYLENLWPANHEGEASVVPVVVFQPPSVLTENKMGEALLKAIGDPTPREGDTEGKNDRIKILVRCLKTLVVCVDNAHDIVQNRREKGVLLIGSWLRTLIDETNILLVLFGTSTAKLLVTDNSQLGRRGCLSYSITHFSIDTKQNIAKYKRFLHEIDKQLPLAKMSNLSDDTRALKIYWATNGIQDFIFQLLIEATIAAVEHGRETITDGDLETAFECMYGDAGNGINPFSSRGPERPLDQKGELFYQWYDRFNPDPNTFRGIRHRKSSHDTFS